MSVGGRFTFSNNLTRLSSHNPPQYYEEALEDDPGYLFEARFGLLLEDAVHHAFDRGELALFEQVCNNEKAPHR